MAYVDFTTGYTIADPSSGFHPTQYKLSCVDLDTDDSVAYYYKYAYPLPWGIYWKIKITPISTSGAETGVIPCIGMCNRTTSWGGWFEGGWLALWHTSDVWYMIIAKYNNTYGDVSIALSEGQPYWCIVDNDGGPGQGTANIYSDATYTTLVDTIISTTTHWQYSPFYYFHLVNIKDNNNAGRDATFDVEDVDIGGDIRGYTRGNSPLLPSDDINLAVNFIGKEYDEVEADDDDFAIQSGSSGFSIYLFKDSIGQDTDGSFTCKVKTSLPCYVTTVYLQVYNRTTGGWENLDSNSTTEYNTEFTLTGTIPQSGAIYTDYYDEDNKVACRIYQ